MSHKIMVVDDNSATRRMVKNALVRGGYEVLEAPDGKTARELMKRENPRVVLQDLMLPDTDGFKLVAELRDLASSDVSILAFSGFVSKLDEARVSVSGFDDIIPKPIAPSRLVPLIEAHLPAAASMTEKFGINRRLVVADDDPIQLKLATFRLSRLGFEVESVTDGASALAAIRRRVPDAVVSDVMMPELDGFGLAMALRQDPELRNIPLVLVTSSYVESSDRTLARRAGANDLVLRTPDLAALIDVLRDTLTEDHSGPIAPSPELLPELELERNRRVFRQLERQVTLNTGLAKRCSSLASELVVLTGIAEAVLRHRDVDVALDEAIASCFDAGGVSYGALYLVEGGVVRVRPLGAEIATLRPIDTFFGREPMLHKVIDSNTTLYVKSGDDPALLADANARAILLVPLSNTDGPLGALMMVSRERDLDEGDWRVFAQGVGTQISQVLTLARAYSALEAAERKAEEHAAVLQAVVENAPDYVMQLDLQGVIGFMNRTVSPYDLEKVIGTNWFDALTPEERPRARGAFASVIEHGRPVEIELQGLRFDSSPGWYQVRMGVVKNQDKAATGVVIVARDVTEKKQTEMQLMLADRMASVGTLAAGVAHEINNPLAAVIANLDMAEHDILQLGTRVELPPDLVEEIHDARMSADRVREIVRDLKVFSRAQEDRRGAVDVEKVLESTLRMAQNEIRHRARVEKVYGKVPRVDANEGRLGQVLLNLIVNAVQAIPEGNYESNEIKITTSVDHDTVLVTISDTGTGIPPELQRRLFTPFFTTKPAGVGTGLGLAISHRIVTALGGSLDFVSEVGKGTTFRVRLPIAPPQLPAISERIPLPLKVTRRGRVLVIDDEDSLVQAIRRYMSQDHEVDGTTSARQAIEMLARGERYDAIVCDLMMPQITGMDVYAAVKKIDPVMAERMVFVTGGAFTESARHFLDTLPPGRHIEKPFDLKALRALINDQIR
ncbi:MAG TPA: response regulator [Kofleriaceae bacterium]|nr:response regulator [Kofleriaceae bacterium]